MAEIKMKMAIDPFRVVENALACARKVKVPETLVSIDYDDGADVLYVKFKHTKIIDNEPLDKEGLVMASLDAQNKVVGLVIMGVSKFVEKCKS